MLENASRTGPRLEERIVTTLKLVEERGYNLTLNALSEKLVGGKVNPEELKHCFKQMVDVEYDGFFVARKGNLQSEKCRRRIISNKKLQNRYLTIAHEFLADFLKLCPWVKCVLIAGSMASEGLSKEDDIDLDIIVEDGTKYSTWLLGLILCFRYSLKYRKEFSVRWFNSLARVICLSVIWESHQTGPFLRNDGQLAYELLTVKVLYNNKYFRRILKMNPWVNTWFPQLLQNNESDIPTSHQISQEDRKKIPFFVEGLCRLGIILLYHVIRSSIFWNDPLKERMDYVNKVKYPYAILDNPKNISL